MSIEISDEQICVNLDCSPIVYFTLTKNDSGMPVIEVDSYDDYGAYTELDKPELAQLIAALQTMHDKMIDNNISK